MPGYLTKKQIVSSAAIAIICLVGDKNSKPLKDVDLAAAICDNVTHAFVGMMIWGSVLVSQLNTNSFDFYLQIIICGICSSLIDADHFVTAKSFSLKDATNLKHRPVLHCTSGSLFICSIMSTLAFKFRINWLYKFSWILVAAFLSHHIRDSTRRGFWIWPFGSTKPLPYVMYVAAEVLLPHIISLFPQSINVQVSHESHNVLNV